MATLRAATLVVLLQAVGLVVIAGVLIYLDSTRGGTSTRIAVSVTGYVVTMTVLLLAIWVALLKHQRWARGPAIVLELLQIPVGFNMLMGGSLLGIPVLCLSLVCVVLLLAPATRTALGID